MALGREGKARNEVTLTNFLQQVHYIELKQA